MNALAFVDTNSLLYWLDSTHKLKQSVAERGLRQLWQEKSGRTSIQVLNEYYTAVTRKLPHRRSADEAWSDVEILSSWNPRPSDAERLKRARAVESRFKLSWWDSLIVAGAQLQECSPLLTADLQHGMELEGVRVCDPFSAQVSEASATYLLSVVSKHRRPGRPRKRSG